MLYRRIGIQLSCCLLAACATSAPDPVFVTRELQTRSGSSTPAQEVRPQLADGLSEDEAVAAAIENNPDFRVRLARLGVSAADLQRAQTLANPSLSALFGSPWELTLLYPIDLLWKRPWRVKAGQANYASQVQHALQDGLTLVADTRLAYVQAQLDARKVALAESSVTRTARVSRIATSRVEAGDISGLEGRSVAAEAAVAEQRRAQARLAHELAVNNLRRLTRLDAEVWEGSFEDLPPAPLTPLDAEALIALAWQNRPDVRAAALEVEAAGAATGLARAQALSLAAGAKLTEVGNDTQTRIAADAPIPLFDRGQADVSAARARLEAATLALAALRHQAALDVRDAVASLQQLDATGRSWREVILPQLEDNVQRSERAYEAGDTAYLVVLDQQRLLIDAQLQAAESAAALRRAAAELARAIGGVVISKPGATSE